MKGKYIDSTHIETIKKYVIYNGRVYTNPLNNPALDLLEAGYKDIVNTTMPSYNENEQKLVAHYEEKATTIEIQYEVVDLTEEEKELL